MSNAQQRISELESELSRLKAELEHAADYKREKDQLEKEHHRSLQRFKTIFEESVIGKKIIDDQLKIIKVNRALLEIMGYPEGELLGRVITDFSHPDFVAHWKRLQHEIWTTNMTSFNFETCLIKKSGATVWVHVTTILIEDGGSKLGYTILENISERKELERLRDIVRKQEQRQQIAETILNTQEEERRRVAESLHNGLGQLLYGVRLSLNQLNVKHNDNPIVDEQAFRYTEQLLADSIRECRRISHDLMPHILEEQGLKYAVQDICSQLTGDVEFSSSIKGFEKRIPKHIELAIYRIIQELMLNIVKHSEATQAWVNVTASESAIDIEVKDNGKGFNEKNVKTKGIGLQTVRYKADLLSSTFAISSSAGETVVRITLPKRVD